MKTLILAILAMALFGCGSVPSASVPKNVRKAVDNQFQSVTDYGQGVYHFGRTGADFGNLLSAFLAKHSDLEFAGFTPSIYSDSTARDGYWVVFRKKAPAAVSRE